MSHGDPGGTRPTQPRQVTAVSIPRPDTAGSSSNPGRPAQPADDTSVGSSISPPDSGHPRGSLLQDSLFPDFNQGAPRPGMDSPDELQRRDPLATQIWKLYSRTKAQLPNQERMENLTWRMMAMSLKRKEQERSRQARYALPASALFSY